MKKNIGSTLALYPMPVAVIGAMNGGKPTWTLAGHLGIIGHGMTYEISSEKLMDIYAAMGASPEGKILLY